MSKKKKKKSKELSEPPEEPGALKRIMYYLLSNYKDFSIIYAGQIKRF